MEPPPDNPEDANPTPDGSDGSGNEDPASLITGAETKDRRVLFIIGIVTVLVVAAVVINATRKSDDTPTTATSPETTEEVTPLEACIHDTVDLINEHIAASNAGDNNTILRKYGSEDPRSGELFRINAYFQNDILRLGQTEGERLLLVAVRDYCNQYELGNGPQGITRPTESPDVSVSPPTSPPTATPEPQNDSAGPTSTDDAVAVSHDLFEAWGDSDRSAAAAIATDDVIDTLFSYDSASEGATVEECDSQPDGYVCRVRTSNHFFVLSLSHEASGSLKVTDIQVVNAAG